MVKYIQLLLLVFLLVCCTESIKLEKVKIAYMDQYGLTPSDVECNGIFAYNPREIEVTEDIFLKKLHSIIRKIKSSNQEECDRDIDVRIACLLRYSNDTADTLCMGAFRGTVLNGEIICDHKDLSQMIKGLVYPNSDSEEIE